MTDIHAALGVSQLARLNAYVERRHEITDRYEQEFSGTNLRTPYKNPINKFALQFYVIQVAPSRHKSIFTKLRENNIGVNLHNISVHTQPHCQKFGFAWDEFPNSEDYYNKAVTFQFFSPLQKMRKPS